MIDCSICEDSYGTLLLSCDAGGELRETYLIFYSVWYDVVWCMIWGMVWYDMVWYGMVWYGMVWYGMVWYGMVWYGMWCRCSPTENAIRTHFKCFAEE